MRRTQGAWSSAAWNAMVLLVLGTLAACTSTGSGATTSPSAASVDAAAIEQQIAEVAASFGITDPPQVETIRVVSLVEVAQVRVDCLIAEGFPASLSADGTGWRVESTGDQGDALGLAEYTCAARYPIDPAQTAPLSDEQKQIVTDYLLVDLPACLAEQGYPVDDVPSRATFLGGYEDAPPWNPYTALYPTLGAQEGEDLTAVCPPNTPPSLLYGEQ